jgi:hypothetical protein
MCNPERRSCVRFVAVERGAVCGEGRRAVQVRSGDDARAWLRRPSRHSSAVARRPSRRSKPSRWWRTSATCRGYGRTPRTRGEGSLSRCSSGWRSSGSGRCTWSPRRQRSPQGSWRRFRAHLLVMVGARGVAPRPPTYRSGCVSPSRSSRAIGCGAHDAPARGDPSSVCPRRIASEHRAIVEQPRCPTPERPVDQRQRVGVDLRWSASLAGPAERPGRRVVQL